MIADLKPYPEYKESGLSWLGRVPGHWELKRAKSFVSNVVEQTTQMNSGDVYVALENIESWTGRVRPQQGEHLFTGQVKRFRSEDVLFGKLRPYLAKVTRLQSGGVCVGELFVLRPCDACVRPDFLEQLLRAKHTIDVINSSTFGAKMPRADWQFVGNLSLVLPPLAEQTAIVRFLDWANGRLERAIRAKRKVIALLNEQKQAIIHRAATRGLPAEASAQAGLDPTVALKPSGIPWLGDIPQHWEMRPLKAVCKIQSGITLGKDYAGQTTHEYPYLRVANVQAGHANLAVVKTIRVTKTEALRCILQEGDVLMTEGGDPDKLGRGCVWDAQVSPCLHQNHVFAVRPNQSLLKPHFLSALMGTHYARTYFESTAKQTTNLASTNKTKIGQFAVLLPSVDEQQRILTALNKETHPVNTAISRLEREIELLREYRTRLVADVVTGKLDVREAAMLLPEEVTADAVAEIAAETLDGAGDLDDTEAEEI